MRVLLYSTVLYLTGIALTLYFRPSLMFRNDGRWKEFGLNGTDTTYCPFWLFCIVWAVVAHGIIRLFFSEAEVNLVHSAATMASLTSRVHEASAAPHTQPVQPIPPPSSGEGEEASPGYYKLNTSLMKRKGIPRYIYIGTEKPEDMED